MNFTRVFTLLTVLLALSLNAELLRNSELKDADGDGIPDQWYKLTQYEGTVTMKSENGVDFVRLGKTDAGENCILQQFRPVTEGKKDITVSARVRWSNVVRGAKGWQVANIQVMFADFNNKRVGSYQSVRSMTGSSKGWMTVSKKFQVPAKAVQVRVQIALYEVSKGTLDVEWVKAEESGAKAVTATDAGKTAVVAVEGNLLKNTFLADADGNGQPDDWYKLSQSEGTLTYKNDKGFKYLRIGHPKKTENCIVQQYVRLPEGTKKISVAAQVRWIWITRGKAGWNVGNVQVMFENASRKRTGSYIGLQSMSGNSKGWKNLTKTIDVPVDAVKVRIQIALYNVKKGELDVAWVSLVTGDKPLVITNNKVSSAPVASTPAASQKSVKKIPLPKGDGPEYGGVKGVNMLGDDPLHQIKPYRQVDGFKVDYYDVKGQPFSKVMKVTQHVQPKASWDMQMRGKATAPINAGDKLLLTFYVRGKQADTEFAEVTFYTTLEMDRAPWTKNIYFAIRQVIKPEWTKVQRVFTAKSTLAAKDLAFSYQFGFEPQIFEIAGLSLYNYGPDVNEKDLPTVKAQKYEGYELDHPWRAEAEERIKKYRMADMKIKVVDAGGKPVSGAKVHVAMKNHKFRWGTAMYRWSFYGSSEKARTYRAKCKELFNFIVPENGHKWRTWEEKKSRAVTKQMVDWALKNNIEVRAHTTVWPSFARSPERLKKLRFKPDALRAEIDKHFEDIIPAERGRVIEWDVVNEPNTNHDFMNILGVAEMGRWFKKARELDPDCKLYINENSILSGVKIKGFERWIDAVIDNGGKIDGIGIQGHLGFGTASPARMLGTYDRLAKKYNAELAITELDILTDDPEEQAHYLRDVMIASFSHPSMVSFVFWGFWDGRHWKKNCPLYKEDWTPKPGLKAYKDLVFKDWWTDEMVATAKSGEVSLRAFKGDYEITVEKDGKKAVLNTELDADCTDAIILKLK